MKVKRGLAHFVGQDREQVRQIAERLSSIPYVEAVIVFGSVARGEARPDSDLDLLVVARRNAGPGEHPEIFAALTDLPAHRDLGVIVTDLTELEPHFIRNILSDGVVVQGELLLPPEALGLEKWFLVRYAVSQCNPSARVGISRMVRGFTAGWRGKSRAGRRYPGEAEKAGGRLLGPATLLIPADGAVKFIRRLRTMRARVTTHEVWR